MLTFALVLGLTSCDGDEAPSDKAAAKPVAASALDVPPSTLSSLRFGSAFAQGCWFASYTEAQRKDIKDVATKGVAAESAARTAVATGLLDLTQAVADKKPDTEVPALGEVLAASERALYEAQLSNLVALVAVMGKDQLAAGGSQCGTKSLSGALSTNAWLLENNPFEFTPPDVKEEAALAAVVTRKLAVSRSFLTFQGASAAAGGTIEALDLTAPDWQASLTSAEGELLTAWQAHRAATITQYGQWAVGLADTERNRLVLTSAVQAALSLPPDQAAEGPGGQGGGMGGPGGQGGGMGGPGGQGGQGGGMGGPGGQGGGMGGQGGQGGGMGGPGGQGGQGGGLGGPGGQGGGMGGQGGPSGAGGGMGGPGTQGSGMGGGQMGGGQGGQMGSGGQGGGTPPAQGGPK